MDAQLRLLAGEQQAQRRGSEVPTTTWRLSTTAREVGRKGIAQAREALRAARRPDDDRPAQAA